LGRAVAISIEQLRKLLAQPPTEDTARGLKEWRAQKGLSQTEAAIALGVPVRTLQGWELGRPMPYPLLLQRATNIPIRPADRYSLVQSDFPREFAEFIDFVGAKALEKEIRTIEKRLGALEPGTRSLYSERYFFHKQCLRFANDSSPFRLDISDRDAVRAAMLMVGINRVKRSLSAKGVSRLHQMVIDNLKSDRDIRQLEHEIRCSTHFGQKGFKVTFADLEGLGNFDLLVETPSAPIEVECKTVSEDTGAQIKSELAVNLLDCFGKIVAERPPVDEPGLFTMKLNRAAADCKNLPRKLEQALCSAKVRSYRTTDFSLTFSPRPQWQELLDSEGCLDPRQIMNDSDIGEHARCIMISAGKVVALDIRPHKPSTWKERVIRVVKHGADQCTGEKPSVVWLHFVGVAEAEFQSLAEFSIGGNFAGLNGIVAKAVKGSTDRTHVHTVRFSSDGGLRHHPTIGPDLVIARSVIFGGILYNAYNHLCRFQTIDL
jgi:transcriptional regulator with XRE-family HTH domain